MAVNISSIVMNIVCLYFVPVLMLGVILVCLCLAFPVFRLCIPILNLYVSIEHAILFVYIYYLYLLVLFIYIGVEAAISSSLFILLLLSCFCSLLVSFALLFVLGFWFLPLFPDLFIRCIPFVWFLPWLFLLSVMLF